jgi:predicted aspartyl protease
MHLGVMVANTAVRALVDFGCTYCFITTATARRVGALPRPHRRWEA